MSSDQAVVDDYVLDPGEILLDGGDPAERARIIASLRRAKEIERAVTPIEQAQCRDQIGPAVRKAIAKGDWNGARAVWKRAERVFIRARNRVDRNRARAALPTPMPRAVRSRPPRSRTETGTQAAASDDGGGKSASSDDDGGDGPEHRSSVSGFPFDFSTAEEIAVRVGINVKTLYAAIAAGTIAGVLRVGRVIRVAHHLMLGGSPPRPDLGDPADRILTAEETATYLRVDIKTIRDAAKDGVLPVTKFGNAYRFSRARLLQYASSGQGRGSRIRSRQ